MRPTTKLISVLLVLGLCIAGLAGFDRISSFEVLDIASGELTNETALGYRSTITITSNGEYTGANGVVDGAGTQGDPYIIENWTINASGTNSITISNTNAYVVIRNCWLRGYNTQYGVSLNTVDNVIIEHCRFSNLNTAIYLQTVDNLLLADNNVTVCSTGFNLRTLTNGEVRNNTITGMLMTGISMWNSAGNDLINNTIFDVGQHAVSLTGSSNSNVFYKNNITDSNNNGFNIIWSNSNELLYNRISMTANAISFNQADNSLIKGNNISDTNNGVQVWWCDGTTVDGNNLTDCSNGIYAWSGNVITIDDNNITMTTTGILLNQVTSASLSGNNMTDTGILFYGIAIGHYNTHTIDTTNEVNWKPVRFYKDQSVAVSVPADTGQLIFANCQNQLIEDLNLSSNFIGVLMGWCSSSTIRNCDLDDQVYGVYLHGSDDILVHNNSCDGQKGTGVYLAYTDFTRIQNNSCNWSQDYGVFMTTQCNDNIIRNNTCIGNMDRGIYLSTAIRIRNFNNTIAWSETGIYLNSATSAVMRNNTIHNCSKQGIYIYNSQTTKSYDNHLEMCGFAMGGFVLAAYNTQKIDATNTVNGRPVRYVCNSTGETVPTNTGQMLIVNSDLVIANDINCSNASMGVVFAYSTFCVLGNISCNDNWYGAYVSTSSENNWIYNSTFLRCERGIYSYFNGPNRYTNNIAMDNNIGIYIQWGTGKTIIENNTCHINDQYGVSILSNSGNLIMNNSLQDNMWAGLHLTQSSTNIIDDNTIYGTVAGHGMFLNFTCDDNVIGNNTIQSNSANGITLYMSDLNIITDNIIDGNVAGINMYSNSNTNTVGNNTIDQNNVGINCSGSTGAWVHNNSLYLNDIGIIGWSVSSMTTEYNHVEDCSMYGVWYKWSTWNIVKNNTIELCGLAGLFLNGSVTMMVHNNTFPDCGILISGLMSKWNSHFIQDTNTVDGKPVLYYKNTFAFSPPQGAGQVILANCYDFTVARQVLTNGTAGVLIGYCTDSTVWNVTTDNNRYGMYVAGGTDLIMTFNSTFSNNDVGVYLEDSVDNTFYNNIFDNPTNYQLSNADDNNWNITKEPGLNAIGGDNRGGNYWNDYLGEDTDGDWLGDTLIPHGPGDELPLAYDIIRPGITDVTSGNPTTGDPFNLRAGITEERVVALVKVEYWFGAMGAHTNVTMDFEGTGVYNYSFMVPNDSIDTLFYKFFAEDEAGNNISSPILSRPVVDDVRPWLLTVDYPSVVAMNEDINVFVTLDDNVAIGQVRINFTHVDGTVLNLSMNPESGGYRNIISGKAQRGLASFYIWFTDAGVNGNKSGTYNVLVRDDTAPVVAITSPTNNSLVSGTVNVHFSATDGHSGLAYVALHVIDSQVTEIYNATPVSLPVVKQWGTAVHDDGLVTLKVIAVDHDGNEAIDTIVVTVDNTKPIADAGENQNISVGESAVLNGNGSSDANGIESYRWSLVDDSYPHNLTGEKTSYIFNNEGSYVVTLTVTDPAGNEAFDTMIVTVTGFVVVDPYVVETTPFHADVDVPLDTTVSITFSQAMSVGSVTSVLSITPAVNFNVSSGAGDTIVTMTFDEDLAYETEYTVTIGAAAGADGGTLQSVYTFSFTTIDAPPSPPPLIPKIFITEPASGGEYEPSESVTVKGTSEDMVTGVTITVTVDGEEFQTIAANDGNWTVIITLPDEPGTYIVSASASGTEDTITVIIPDDGGGDGGDGGVAGELGMICLIIGIIVLVLIIIAVIVIVIVIMRKKGAADEEEGEEEEKPKDEEEKDEVDKEKLAAELYGDEKKTKKGKKGKGKGKGKKKDEPEFAEADTSMFAATPEDPIESDDSSDLSGRYPQEEMEEEDMDYDEDDVEFDDDVDYDEDEGDVAMPDDIPEEAFEDDFEDDFDEPELEDDDDMWDDDML